MPLEPNKENFAAPDCPQGEERRAAFVKDAKRPLESAALSGTSVEVGTELDEAAFYTADDLVTMSRDTKGPSGTDLSPLQEDSVFFSPLSRQEPDIALEACDVAGESPWVLLRGGGISCLAVVGFGVAVGLGVALALPVGCSAARVLLVLPSSGLRWFFPCVVWRRFCHTVLRIWENGAVLGWGMCGFKAWGCGRMRKLSVLVSGFSTRDRRAKPQLGLIGGLQMGRVPSRSVDGYEVAGDLSEDLWWPTEVTSPSLRLVAPGSVPWEEPNLNSWHLGTILERV